MPRTVVVVPRHAAVLPAAALPALRAARVVVAAPGVPAEIAAAAGAVPGDDVTDGVLLVVDPPVAGTVVALPAGSALIDAVAVMDRLRSPGGCPWDAEQTHASLLQYLVEECYELYQAIEDADRAAIREELGDVLLQVLFHARVAAEHPAAFDIDDVAAELVAKLVGRHPHVFPTAGSDAVERVHTAARQEHRWEELKRAEKRRDSSVDGVPTAQPAIALAAKLTSRTARAGLPAELLPAGDGVGEALFALAARAKLAGVDPEAALRTVALRFARDVRAAERSAAGTGADPHALGAADWAAHWPS